MKIEKIEKHYNVLLKCSKEDFRVKNLPYLQPFEEYIKELKYGQVLEILEYAEKRRNEVREIFLKDYKDLENDEEGSDVYDIWLDDNPDYQDIEGLYYKLLMAKFKLNYLQNQKAMAEIEDTGNSEKRLQVKQIALIHVFEGKQITQKNASEIAASYGYVSPSSGVGLLQDYDSFLKAVNRTAKPFPYTSKKMLNKINLFRSIQEYLSESNKKRLLEEIKILETHLENSEN